MLFNKISVLESKVHGKGVFANEFLNKNISETKINILDLSKPNSWINVVTTETNKDDGFHYDNASLSVVTYLNDNFEGGLLKFEADHGKNNFSIQPTVGSFYIFHGGHKNMHEVTLVKNGTRYTIG